VNHRRYKRSSESFPSSEENIGSSVGHEQLIWPQAGLHGHEQGPAVPHHTPSQTGRRALLKGELDFFIPASDLSQSILVKEKHWAENFVRDVTYVMRFAWPHDVDDSCKTLKDSEWECYVSVWMKCIRLNDVHPFEWNASVAKAVPLFSYSGCFASLSNRSSCAKQWLADSESVTEYSLMKG